MVAFPGLTPALIKDVSLFDFRVLASFIDSQTGGVTRA